MPRISQGTLELLIWAGSAGTVFIKSFCERARKEADPEVQPRANLDAVAHASIARIRATRGLSSLRNSCLRMNVSLKVVDTELRLGDRVEFTNRHRGSPHIAP